MKGKSFFERGSIMVEVIAVLGLLGTMSVLMFRQVQQRNEELDNINIASDIRVIKEATIAYIQANHAALEDQCKLEDYGDKYHWELNTEEIEDFLPEYMASDGDDGLINDYNIYATCYMVNPAIAPRIAIYGTIIPKADAFNNLTLRRVSRIANLIGSDGGIFFPDEDDKLLHGTMGSWEVGCPASACDDRDDTFFVATTGMDIYIPEAEQEATNTVAVPQSLAFKDLHSTEYFSVGPVSCVDVIPDGLDYKFAHEDLDALKKAQSDKIYRPNGVSTGSCDPLFWVSVRGAGTSPDTSKDGQVYVKNNLYIGRDNKNNKQAVAIETGSSGNDRKITVYNADGKERLILNAHGQIVGRSDGARGFLIDSVEGEIVLFDEANITLAGGGEKAVRIPSLRLKNGVMETNTEVTYMTNHAGSGDDEKKTDKYKIDPAYTSIMNDIRLTSRGGAKLSDILPNYISKAIYAKTVPDPDTTLTDRLSWVVSKPTDCPRGYVRAVMITPVTWSQYVTQADLNIHVKGATENRSASGSHNHDIDFNIEINNDNKAKNSDHEIKVHDDNASQLHIVQKKPIQIVIDGADGAAWSVSLTYGGENPTDDDKIAALAQTFCVYDKANFSGTETKSDGRNDTAFGQEAGSGHTAPASGSVRPCTTDHDCNNTESCSGGICTSYGSCPEASGQPVESKGGAPYYCISGKITYIQCTEDTDCSSPGSTCVSYRCKSSTP